MLNKKNNKKRFGTYTMVVMYCLGLFFSFTMFFLQEWQHINYQNQINQTDKIQLLHFTAKDWHATENKREFKINGVYYDVHSISYKENLVVAKVVKDELENEIRLLLTQTFQKQISIPAHKKKGHSLSVHEPTSAQWKIEDGPKFFVAKNSINNKKNICNWLLSQKLFRPPC
jgi:hypothetical protein